jgi:hypothetical protein
LSEIQQLLDEIAVETGSGVSLDDLAGRLVAYSTHHGRADDARVRALLERRSPEDVRSWETQHGAVTATRPLVIPANDELGMSPRICLPLLHHGIRTGLLFLIAEGPSPSQADAVAVAERLVAPAEALAALLYESSSPRLESHRVREAALLAACRGDGVAARRLAEDLAPAATGRSMVLIVTLLRARGTEAGSSETEHETTQTRVAAHQALGAGPGVIAHAVTATHVVALVRRLSAEPAEVGSELHQRLLGVFPAGDLTSGVCVTHDLARDVDVAYSRARTAARAAAVGPALGPVCAWEDIGIYQLLGQLGDVTPRSELFDRVVRAPNGELLLSTLESVYDHPGGVAAAAGSLNLHRTSLYHRLGKVRDLLGADPLDGQTRTELHLALKLRRWAGRPLT